MRKIIASLDIGSYSLKLLVGEIQKNKVNVLSCVEVPSQGIKKGYIVNPESAELALKEAFVKTEELLGLPVKKVLVTVPCYNLNCFVSSGHTMINTEDKIVTHEDIIKAMQRSIYKKLEDNQELVSILPTKYLLNDEQVIPNPINAIANKLTVNDVVVTLPKKNTQTIIKTLEKIGIKVVDSCISPLADYYEFKKPEINSQVGAVVNIGQNNTVVSVFNKGILIATEVIDLGASIIDNDIAFVFKINKKDANYLKERLVVADMHMALPSEAITIKNINNEDVKINQYDISAVVTSRLDEIFNLVKKQINLLTKKEISYIIVSGGSSEIKYFERYLQNIFGDKAVVGKVNEIGARHNKFSVAMGMIKYYQSRLKLRNTEFSIFSLEEQEELSGSQRKINVSDNSILGKIYGYFFDN